MDIKRYTTIIYVFCSLLLLSIKAIGQSRPPVLILYGNNEYTTHFDTQNQLTSQLINSGLKGQATVEFWVMKGENNPLTPMKGGDGSWKYSNLLQGSMEFTLSGNKGVLQVNVGNQEETIALNGENGFWNNQWHHVAFTVNQANSSLKLFVDGEQKANLSYPNKNFHPETMFFMVTNDDQLSIAEYRGWNKLRTLQQIEGGRLLTYSNENQNNLERLNGNGLVVAYAANSAIEERVSNLPMEQIAWNNMVTSAMETNIPQASRVTSAIIKSNENKLRLAELTTNVDHPIYSLKDVLLYASDGEGKNTSGKPVVSLKWPHISGATNYIIARRNLADSHSNFGNIATYKPASNTAVSSYVTFDDDAILPNELYEYQVTAEGVQGSNPGTDNGFVFANGVIHGKVETPNFVATKEVLLTAGAITENLQIPGNALSFSTTSSPIAFNDVSLFEELNRQGTIEFWYRTPNTSAATNTIFKLSEMEIRMSGSQIKVLSKKGQQQNETSIYVQANKPNDSNWHHYAITFGADGGAIYIDGGIKQPTNKETPVVPNAVSQTPFEVSLNKVSRFLVNASLVNPYELDELRIWKVKRPVNEIYKYWNLILGENIFTELAAYYRFDMRDKHNVYNQAAETLGRFRGTSVKELSLTKQPFTSVSDGNTTITTSISYGVYTNQDGRYRFTSINSGRQNLSQANNYLEYRVTPSKPNNEFSPISEIRNIPRELMPREPVPTNFTNISTYDVSGKVVYLVNEGNETVEYPTIQSTGIKLDGVEVTSAEAGSLVRTNNEGVYRISADPGRHLISAGQPTFESTNIDIDRISLDFKNNGYAETIEKVSNGVNQGFTWSGFLKPDVNTPGIGGSTEIPEIQTIFHWGKLKLELHENNKLVVISGETPILSKGINGNSSYTFFAITRDTTNNVLGLWVNNDYQTVAYSGEEIDSKVYVGASYLEPSKMKNYSLANLDIFEFRNEHYSPSEISAIKEGDIVEKDKAHLKLSYTFEHRTGARAVNLALDSGIQNNYLFLHEGAYFNQESSSQYFRKSNFTYKAFEEGDSANLVNPENTEEYLFNLTEPVSNINFENITRRSFVGNIVIPCNYSVGNWTGKIQRTDVAFPRYERQITPSDFNSENNLFTIHDLVPGQYRVEITNEDSGDVVQSSIIDLQQGNKSYDFPYRKELKAELVLYSVMPEELVAMQSMTELESKRITPTCGNDGSIYKLNAGQSILATVSVFEQYNGGKCPVEGAEVNLNGDMIFAAADGYSDAKGKQSFLTLAGNPNFIGDYLRNLSIVVSHNNRNISVTKSSYITGAQRGNKDFTLTDPTVGFLLYDPPGDGSSSSLTRGASYAFSKSVGGGLDITTSTAVTVGSDIETQMVSLAIAAPLGVGIGQGLIYTVTEQSSDFSGNIDTKFTYRHTEQNGTKVSLDQAIKTPSSKDIVGEDADVFVGASRVLTFGTGKTLTVDDNCQPSIDYDKTVMTADELTPFVYTRQDIEDRVIRNLQDLLIYKHDQLFPPSSDELANRSSLDYQATIDGFNINMNSVDTDKDVINYLYQIEKWKEIVKRKTREEKLTYMNEETRSFASTTSDLETVGGGLGTSVTQLDSQISFSGGTSTTYTLTRGNDSSNQDSGGSNFGGGTTISNRLNIAGVSFSLKTDLKTMGVVEASDNTQNANSRVDSFTLTDGDVGDQFSVRIARDKMYDTPIFYSVAGQSSCPFESGTVPRQGVEITVDNAVKYGSGEESILYELTLRNTQIANDASFKSYDISINGNTNEKGALVYLNGQQLLNGVAFPIRFGADGESPTGVNQEVKAQLRIARGIDAPEEISYEDIDIRISIPCYSKYNNDEYKEVGVQQFDKVSLTAHFTGTCISEIEPDLPMNNWVVNNTSDNKLDFRFRIPEVINNQVDDLFSVALEYALPGNNETFELTRLSLTELKENMNLTTGFISYKADVSGIQNGEYRFRITPVCDDGGANLSASRKSPTEFVQGVIARQAPVIISTNPSNGGVLTQGEITAEFNRPINPLTAVNSSFSLRGILGGLPKDLISAEFDNVNDEVTVPHQPEFNLEANIPFTIEAWVNPSSLPNGGTNVSILSKGGNYAIALNNQGKIVVNDIVQSSQSLQPFNWTHVSVVYDGTQTVTIYYNGVSVGSGTIPSLITNEAPIEIAKAKGGASYTGKLDEVRIWTAQRSPTEIVSKMDKQLIGNEEDLVAYFVFDDNALEGVNGAPDEAIRDYTGNAIGTTQSGLSFVSGSAEAAPLDVSKVAKDMQFTVTTSDNDTKVHLIPVFNASFVEGAEITAMVLNKRVEDPSRNKIAGKSWSFVVNKNTIGWSQNNLSIHQSQGESTTISTIDLDNSEGGTSVKYRFKQLPSWLKVSKNGMEVEENSFQDLAAGFVERELDFTVAPYLNPGTHETDVYVEIIQTINNVDIPIGVEAFHLEVVVTCAIPNFAENFNANDYFGSMSITGNLFINNKKSIDTKDIIVAYSNGEYRGQANVESDGIVDLSIFGNPGESGLLSFSVWDASECTEYKGIVETYSYSYRERIGSITTPASLTVGERISKRMVLVKGFQELSFNVKDNHLHTKLSLQSIKGLVSGDEIYDSETSSLIARVAADGSYIISTGMSSQLEIRKAYTVKASSARLIIVEGLPVSLDTNIDIMENMITGIPYFPNDLQTLPIALRSLNASTVSIGDRIERRGLQAEYTQDGWKGSLTHLTPGLGYLYTASKEGVLNYTGIAGRKAMPANIVKDTSEDYLEKAAAIHWKVDRNAYPNFMYLIGTIESVDIATDKEYTIGAFVDGKVRGIAKPVLIEDRYHYFIGIGGFQEGEVTFQLFDGKDVISLDNRLSFSRGLRVGSSEEPFVFEYSRKILEENDKNDTYILGQNTPNPMKEYTRITYQVPEDQFVDISIYNMIGQKIYTLVSQNIKGNRMHSVEWKNEGGDTSLKSGVYIYKLKTSNKTITKKMIVE
ncbi:LamG-like jellyroll fold domain-containing protein [Tenacibaculum sp. nBUS_03]|uniref:LamG-like jellyroll fold domain-containing protein n=1 Tax=Tenacibaculum sp. nBUS_03 TaxID=3395320 RepID=UPI003EB77348